MLLSNLKRTRLLAITLKMTGSKIKLIGPKFSRLL
jgi:hypothetical protein